MSGWGLFLVSFGARLLRFMSIPGKFPRYITPPRQISFLCKLYPLSNHFCHHHPRLLCSRSMTDNSSDLHPWPYHIILFLYHIKSLVLFILVLALRSFFLGPPSYPWATTITYPQMCLSTLPGARLLFRHHFGDDAWSHSSPPPTPLE